MYASVICTIHSEKEEKDKTQIMFGSNLITDYPGEVSTKTADLASRTNNQNPLENSVLSTPGAKWMGMDIFNMYLNAVFY